jgi:hypothetical protein
VLQEIIKIKFLITDFREHGNLLKAILVYWHDDSVFSEKYFKFKKTVLTVLGRRGVCWVCAAQLFSNNEILESNVDDDIEEIPNN